MSPSCWFCPCREYYFSDENLQKDFFLRRQVRSNGLLHQKAFGTRPVWDNTSSMLCPTAHFVGEDQTVRVSTWALLCLPVALAIASYPGLLMSGLILVVLTGKTWISVRHWGQGTFFHSFDLCQVNQ